MTKEEIKQRMATDDDFLVGCFLKMIKRNAMEERTKRRALDDDSRGFDRVMLPFALKVYDFYLRRGFVSLGQLAYLRQRMPRYAGQLISTEVIPRPASGRDKQLTVQENRVEIPQQGGCLRVFCRYDKDKIACIKLLEGWVWAREPKNLWLVDLTSSNIERLKEWGWKLSPTVEAWYAKRSARIASVADAAVSELRGELWPFQKKGVEFLEERQGRALLADEMRLGKTVQVLAYLQAHPEFRPAAVVCPMTANLVWSRMAHSWMPRPDIEVLRGTLPYTIRGSLVILHYNIFDKWKETLKPIIKTWIFDEAHMLRNPTTLRSKAAVYVCENIEHVIGTTGTPVVNRPVEMYTILHIIAPNVFPSFWKYTTRWCDLQRGYVGGLDSSGASNSEELHKVLVGSCMLRRLREDVMPDMPKKQRIVIPLSCESALGTYRRAEVDLIGWLRKSSPAKAESARKAETLVKIGYLNRLAASAKMKWAVEWITEYLEQREKLVTFAINREVIDAVMAAFGPSAVKIDGSCSQEDRKIAIDRFMNDPKARLFVGQLQAAGTAISLTAASDTATLQLGWNPGDHDQAEDRVIGPDQQAESIGAYYLMAADTIEEDGAALLDAKRKVIAMIADGKKVEQASMLTALLAKIKGRHQ